MSIVCENSTCTCTKGYISLGQLCYEGKKFNKSKNLDGTINQNKKNPDIKIGIQVKKIKKISIKIQFGWTNK